MFSYDFTNGKSSLFKNQLGFGVAPLEALVTQASTQKVFGAHRRGTFVEVNPNTGKGKKVGDMGLYSDGGLAFLNGVLYATVVRPKGTPNTHGSYLARVSMNTSTMGKATPVGPIRTVRNAKTTYHNRVQALEVRNGVLYGAMYTGEILRINSGNATATVLGDNQKFQNGLATSPK
ncbi:MAG: hypothetical protein H6993_17455 [Pseudomonadales bacterium]|nr:hypothetical protein [Pseudomonadales bacterium]